MNRRTLQLINLTLAGLAGLLLLWSCWLLLTLWWGGHGTLPSTNLDRVRKLGRNPFEQPAEIYELASQTVLHLEKTSYQLSIPDLTKSISYLGSNQRPDSDPEHVRYHLQLKGDNQPLAVESGEPIYLSYSTETSPPRYVWKKDGEKTRLWIEVQGQEADVSISVKMTGPADQIVNTPEERSRFTLKESVKARKRGEQWQIAGFRVDGTLLARQRARWYGEDLFIIEHGGDEYADEIGKQRLDFGEGTEAYSRWIGGGVCLMWDGKQWQQADPLSGESRDKPLLCVNKLGDKVMSFQLWDVEGRRKVLINLIKSNEIWQPKVLEKEFRFVGARTRSQSVVEVRGVRQTLRPFDWLLFTDGDWRKLSTLTEIDDFVDRRSIGPLFIFEGLEKHEGAHWLRGTLYNSSRTSKHEMLLTSQQNRRPTPQKSEQTPKKVVPIKESPFEEQQPPKRLRRPTTPIESPDGQIEGAPTGLRGRIPVRRNPISPKESDTELPFDEEEIDAP